jgi:4,5-DOPA dioxygenase extradiol
MMRIIRIYPEADIPVVALSVNPGLSPEEYYRIGKAIEPLREKDVLIIGSGGTVHNFAKAGMERRRTEELGAWL